MLCSSNIFCECSFAGTVLIWNSLVNRGIKRILEMGTQKNIYTGANGLVYMKIIKTLGSEVSGIIETK